MLHENPKKTPKKKNRHQYIYCQYKTQTFDGGKKSE